MDIDYDVIIVGARCAGSPLGMLLARQGHKVLLVDRSDFPSDTLSTHYIHMAGGQYLQRWGLLDRVIDAGTPPVRDMAWRVKEVELNGFAKPTPTIDAVYAPRRTTLDKILVDGATEAGADLLTGFSVRGLLHDDTGTVVGIKGKGKDRVLRRITARMVVGADGSRSAVADLAGSRKYNVRPASSFAFWNYYEGLDWSCHHKTGYNRRWFGTWPTDGGTVVGVLASLDQFPAFRADPDVRFLDTIREIEPDMAQELQDAGVPQGPLARMRNPDSFFRTSSGPGWALAGDAGYHKDPITGWGITDAFIQADLLSTAIHDGLIGRRPMLEATDEFVAIRDEHAEGIYDYTTTVAEFDLSPFYRRVVGAVSQAGPDWTSTLLGVVGGVVDGGELFAPDALERLYDEAGVPEDARDYGADPAAAGAA